MKGSVGLFLDTVIVSPENQSHVICYQTFRKSTLQHSTMNTCLLTAILGLRLLGVDAEHLDFTYLGVCDVTVVIDITRLVFHVISTFFLLLTLVLYFLEPALR